MYGFDWLQKKKADTVQWYPCFFKKVVVVRGQWDFNRSETYERWDQIETTMRTVVLDKVEHYECRIRDTVTFISKPNLKFPERS